MPFLDCPTLQAKVLPEKAEGIGVVILATVVVCILSGVILRIFLDGIGHDPLKYPCGFVCCGLSALLPSMPSGARSAETATLPVIRYHGRHAYLFPVSLRDSETCAGVFCARSRHGPDLPVRFRGRAFRQPGRLSGRVYGDC